MSNALVGVENISRKISKVYGGVDNIARRIVKGYVGDENNIARLFYQAGESFTYTFSGGEGSYREFDAIFNNEEYTVLEITKTGTFTPSHEIEVDVWLCGGGGDGNVGDDGGTNTNQESGGGGGSGYVAMQRSLIVSNSVVATIGASHGKTSFGSISANGASTPQSSNSYFLYNGNKGGAGGGAGARLYITDEIGDDGYYISYTTTGGVGQGSGENIELGTPFCATLLDYDFGSSVGGGGGGAQYFDGEAWNGGDGGSYGENGKVATLKGTTISYGGIGAGGGGNGGDSRPYYLSYDVDLNGRNATWYGCGGGGGGFWGQSSFAGGTAGSGYQGVIYLRWKKNQSSSRPIPSEFIYSYSGNCTESNITVNDIDYLLLTLTNSGTLTVNREVIADVWLCGGGGKGGVGSTSMGGGGGGGGYLSTATISLAGSIVATVGSEGGKTTFGTMAANAGAIGNGFEGGAGSSGGGSGSAYTSYIGLGEGTTTRPFSDVTNFPLYHCGGGGGGAHASDAGCIIGGNGGSNGSSGNVAKVQNQTSSATINCGQGGTYGGGDGGTAQYVQYGTSLGYRGGNATYYGGGGGGGGGSGSVTPSDEYNPVQYHYGGAGSGYQGVIYIRIKKEDITQ